MAPAEDHVLVGYCEGVDERALTCAELEDMQARRHAIDNNTMTHRPPSRGSHKQVTDAIRLAVEEIRSRLGDWAQLAWPRGRFAHFTAGAPRVVFDSRDLECPSAERGAHASEHVRTQRGPHLRRDHEMTPWPLRPMDVLFGTQKRTCGRRFPRPDFAKVGAQKCDTTTGNAHYAAAENVVAVGAWTQLAQHRCHRDQLGPILSEITRPRSMYAVLPKATPRPFGPSLTTVARLVNELRGGADRLGELTGQWTWWNLDEVLIRHRTGVTRAHDN